MGEEERNGTILEGKERKIERESLVEPLPLPFGGAQNARASGPFAPLYATPTYVRVQAPCTYRRSLEQGMDRVLFRFYERGCVYARAPTPPVLPPTDNCYFTTVAR